MKTCSTCGNSFSDDLSFCLQDGTVLKRRVTADLNDQPTEIIRGTTDRDADVSNEPTIVDHPTAILPPPSPASTPQKVFQMKAIEPSSRMGCVLSVGQVAAALVVVVGIGVAGLMFLSSNTAPLASKSGGGTSANAPMTNTSYSNAAMNSMNSAAPRPTSAAGGAKTISAGDVTAQAIALPHPDYPPVARQSDVSGTVEVHVLIDEEGKVLSATATSGHVLLRAASENAARGARFHPTLVDGVPVKVSGTITYNFVP